MKMYCQNCGAPTSDNCPLCESCSALMLASDSKVSVAAPQTSQSTVILVKQPLTKKRKLAITAGLLLFIALILSFLPISFASSHWYYDSSSYSISVSSLMNALSGSGFLGDSIIFLYLIGLVSSIILHFITAAGKITTQRFLLGLTLVPSVMYGISCLIILANETYNDISNYVHYYDVMWGMVLHLALLIASLIFSAVIQFKREVQK